MHANQTKLEKNITCKEEKQGTSSKRSKRNKEIEHLGDSSVFFFSFPQPPCSPWWSAVSDFFKLLSQSCQRSIISLNIMCPSPFSIFLLTLCTHSLNNLPLINIV